MATEHVESSGSAAPESSISKWKQHSRKLDAYNEVLLRLHNSGEAKDPSFDDKLWHHFNRLPARYAMDVNVERAAHVLVHMELLQQVAERQYKIAFHVALVQGPTLSPTISQKLDMKDDSNHTESMHHPPMFGSSANLEALTHANSSNLEDIDSNANLLPQRPMYEATFAADDRPKLLNRLTSMLGEIFLNIHEAHAFSTNDGYSLDVFVVEAQKYEACEDLMKLLERELQKLEKEHGPSTSTSPSLVMQAKTGDKSESVNVQIPSDGCDEWEIDFKHLKIEKKIASGTYGDLYRGTYRSQDVAIKILKHERMNTDMEREFAQEVFIMRKVRHKNVVQFIGACTSPPNLCIITEFMSGGSIYDFLHKHKGEFKLSALVNAAIDISKGMDYLHQNNIIHRDLKAANLLMDENKVVKVADFGVARVKCQSGVMTAETGTYRWMAPEVIEHKPYDQKADVFSFGVVLWELLTKEIPYENYTPLQAAVGVVQKGLRPIIPKNTPPKLAHLLEDCWQQDPKKRPDFSEIKERLKRFSKEVKDEPEGKHKEKLPSGFLSALRLGHH